MTREQPVLLCLFCLLLWMPWSPVDAASSPAPRAASSPAPRAASSSAPRVAPSPAPRAAPSPAPRAVPSPAPRAVPSPAPRTPLPGLSVEVRKGFIRVHQQPMTWSPWRGYIGKAGRFPVFARRPPGGNCPVHWYKIGPQAWACSGWLLPRAQEPSELDRMESTWRPGPYVGTQASRVNRVPFFQDFRSLYRGPALWLRGTLGFVVASRRQLGGRTFLRTHAGGYVAEERVRSLGSSPLVGATLRDPGATGSLPLVVALRDTNLVRPGEEGAGAQGRPAPGSPGAPGVVPSSASARAPGAAPAPGAASAPGAGPALGAAPSPGVARTTAPSGVVLRRYSWRSLRRGPRGEPTEVFHLGQRYLVLADGAWVRREDVALATQPGPPPRGVGPHEPWIHIDAVERLVFAMAGPRPVRVMLTSLNRTTPPGVFRVEQKIVFKDMQQRFGDDPFFLEGVPYVVFFRGDFGIHGAYWHDGFGTTLSHGCPNLSLVDARFVFDWIAPSLPPGFLSIFPTDRDRGGVVRVWGRYRRRSWEPPPPRRTPAQRGSGLAQE